MIDRFVHAESPWLEVVRYDRRGHWYIESKLTKERRRVDLAESETPAGFARAFFEANP